MRPTPKFAAWKSNGTSFLGTADAVARGGLGLLDTQFVDWGGYFGEAFFCDDRAEAGASSPAFRPSEIGEDSAVNGNQLPYAAPIQFTVSLEQDFYFEGGARVTPFVKFHWEDEMFFTEGNFDAIPSLSAKRQAYGIFDASVRYTPASEAWNVEAFVYNLTDERFPTFMSDWPGAGAPLFVWNPPRVFGMRFAYNVRP